MEKIWAIVSDGGKRVHRLTFSQSLAKHIVSNFSQYEIKRIGFKVVKKLNVGEKSSSGLYALVSNKGDVVLRVSMIKEIAEIHYDKSSRYLAEVWLI